MKRLLIAVLFILTLGSKSLAQQMIPKQKGFEISYSVFPSSSEEKNFVLTAGLISYGKNGKYFFGIAEYSRRYNEYKEYDIPIDNFLFNGGYSFYLMGDSMRNINVNFSISALVGYEQVNRRTSGLYDGSILNETESFIYGAAGKISLESYLTGHLVFTVNGQLRFLQNSQLGTLHSLIGIGIRCNL